MDRNFALATGFLALALGGGTGRAQTNKPDELKVYTPPATFFAPVQPGKHNAAEAKAVADLAPPKAVHEAVACVQYLSNQKAEAKQKAEIDAATSFTISCDRSDSGARSLGATFYDITDSSNERKISLTYYPKASESRQFVLTFPEADSKGVLGSRAMNYSQAAIAGKKTLQTLLPLEREMEKAAHEIH